jgi:hypothetical protein
VDKNPILSSKLLSNKFDLYHLEGRSVQQVAHLLLAQGLLDQETEEHGVAELPKVVEELGPGVRVLHDVQQLVLVVLQDAGRA